MKKVVVAIGSLVFISLLGSLVVWANISIKNCNDVKIVNSEYKEKIKTKDNTLLKNEQIFETEEIDTSDSINIRIHPVTGEVRENDGSE